MPKKKTIQIIEVTGIRYPGEGVAYNGDEKIFIKHGLPGQKLEIECVRKQKRRIGNILRVIEPSEQEIISPCPDFGVCGGCTFQNIPYEYELQLKREMLEPLFAEFWNKPFPPIIPAPVSENYRNKMELAFGDEGKDGRLSLGIRKRNQYYEVAVPSKCALIPRDFRTIALYTLDFFRSRNEKFYHRIRHDGTLRYLILRRGEFTGELLVNLVTTSGLQIDLSDWKKGLSDLALDGSLAGILHTVSDTLADAVAPDTCRVLFGRSNFYEKICGLTFEISPFSFFQTYSAGAEKLYETVKAFIGEKVNTIYDLYCGTGTIAQLLSSCAEQIIGIEIVPEAVEAARANALANGIDNCRFIAGNVLNEIDSLNCLNDQTSPDVIVVDPPRDGLHPKVLKKILALEAKRLIYVSCKPTSLVRDLKILTAGGYQVEKLRGHDMFPRTPHVECAAVLHYAKKE